MKRRMIIADPDIDYCIKLLEQFSIHYRDVLDIHVITDPDYFYDYFNSGQVTDILVASEDFHFGRFQDNQVEKLFWLTENQNVSMPDSEQVEYLYKYSSLGNLLSRIAKDLGPSQDNRDGGARLIVVTSASGGTGKTTVATVLARMQQELQRKVLYLNVANIQNCSHLFQDESEIPLSSDQKLADQISFSPYSTLIRYIREDGFDYLPAFDCSLSNHDIPLSMFTDFIEKTMNDSDYDVVIADVGSDSPEVQKDLIERANHVVIVAEQSKASYTALEKFLSLISDLRGTEVSILLNKVQRDAGFNETMSGVPSMNDPNGSSVFSFIIGDIDMVQSMKSRDLARHPLMNKVINLGSNAVDVGNN